MQSEIPASGRRERGAVAILLALALVALFGMASFSIDIGGALVTRAELQNVSDAGSLAAGRELVKIYEELPSTTNNKTYELTTADKARLFAKASEFAEKNEAGRIPISVLDDDLLFGTYDRATGEITETTRGVRALRLTARRDDEANGVVETSLARVIGIQEISVQMSAAVGISSLGTMPAGYGEVPVGISSHWFDSNACGPASTIKFFPTGTTDGCAGWHTFEDWPASAARLGRILDGLRTDTFDSPTTTAGETSYNFTGGAVASRFPDMKALYDARKDANGDWEVVIPVYEDTSCANPNGPKPIIGFARARIYDVQVAPNQTMLANVECGVVSWGAGNGPNDFGTLYASPGMIQ